MTEYLPTFIVEPVLRQARRFSRLSSAEQESPAFFPAVPESLRTWYPTRFWPPSLTPVDGEHEEQEGTFQHIARSIQLWTSQLEPTIMEDSLPAPVDQAQANDTPFTDFPPRDPHIAQEPRPVRPQEVRSSSDTSLNPLRDLSHRAREYEDASREHAQSDPDTRTTGSTSIEAALPAHMLEETQESTSAQSQSRDGSGTLPEDDGMGPLRHRINAIWAGDGTPAEKSRLVHILMMERYRVTNDSKSPIPHSGRRPHIERRGSPMSIVSGASQEAIFTLTPEDLNPTYAPVKKAEPSNESEDTLPEASEPVLGCAHYKRNVKLQCNECERWYTCRICHDEAENHVLPRRETRHMLCMLCNTPQPVAQSCRMCAQQAAFYYCGVCKLWNNDPQKSVYHCDDCGICRLGEGLGKDFFHCKKCVACMSIQVEESHRCIEDSTKCDCPICGEYMFTSSNSVVFMRCGHSIHETCFKDWCHNSYKCPICSRSIANMEAQFRALDRQIEAQPMPDEYADTKAFVYCNDCTSKSTTNYHWLGLKCDVCESYNTMQLQLIGRTDPPPVGDQSGNNVEAHMNAPAENIQDEATPVPNSRGASRRQSGLPPHSPVSDSSWLMPHSPTRRSISPIVGSYFGTDASRRENAVRQATPIEDEEELEFWGGQSPRSGESKDSEDESEDVSSDSDDVIEEDEGEEEEDTLALFGHR
jgi:hypothetical protein